MKKYLNSALKCMDVMGSADSSSNAFYIGLALKAVAFAILAVGIEFVSLIDILADWKDLEKIRKDNNE